MSPLAFRRLTSNNYNGASVCLYVGINLRPTNYIYSFEIPRKQRVISGVCGNSNVRHVK